MPLNNVAYLTSDEVNAADAARLGGRAGLRVELRFPKEPLPEPGQAAALAVDLDSLPQAAGDRDAGFRVLAELAGRYPVAVHSYRLDEPAAAFLMAAGVIVAERLDGGLFARLAHAIAGVKRRKVA